MKIMYISSNFEIWSLSSGWNRWILGIIPEEAAESYEELIIKNFYDEIVSEEGRDLTDNHEMDEVSVELLRYQYDLRDTEIQLRGLTQAIWRKLREDFATWTLSEQLDDACYDVSSFERYFGDFLMMA